MTTVIKEVKANEIQLTNESAGISITLEKALQLLPERLQPTTVFATNENRDSANPWYDWEANGHKFSVSSDLIYLDGEGDNLFALFTVTKNEIVDELYYDIISKNRY
jgi:hypothetical protein